MTNSSSPRVLSTLRQEWWREERDDIFATVADTAKQRRPSVFDPLTLERHWARPLALPEPARAPDRGPETQPRTLRVLVADDDEVLQHILGYQLTADSWNLTCCGDGVEAERILRSGDVDLLLIDLNLPHKNAFEILEELAGMGGRPRIIVMSEQVQEDKVLRVFRLGADDFVAKPFNPRVMLSRILRLMSRD